MRMRALFAHVQKSGALAGQYGMSNLDEFVAEAFTNPKFQDALKAIPAPAGSKLQNAWRWFVQAVSAHSWDTDGGAGNCARPGANAWWRVDARECGSGRRN